MPLSNSFSEATSKPSNRRNLMLVFAAGAILALAPSPAFAQHGGGGGGGGGHAGGGGGFSGGGHASGGFHGGGGGSFGGGSEIHSAHGSANSTGGGHWWSGIFGGHSSNSRNAAPAAGAAARGSENSQASIAAQRAFQNAVSRDYLATHNTWQDPPPEFSGNRVGSSLTASTAAPRTNSLLNARPFSPPSRRPLATAPHSAVTVGPISPRGHLRRYYGYPYYYSPYYFGGLGFGFGGFDCFNPWDPFWSGFGWGGYDCFGAFDPYWGGYGAAYGPGAYGYFDNSSGNFSSSPNYQVFSGGADSAPDDSGAVDNNANGNVTYQNSPQDMGVAADQSSPSEEQPFVLYMKDGSSYAVTRYWVQGGKLHYVTTYGGENVVALDQLNVQRTVDENAALGHTFTLAPAPGASKTQPDGPPSAPPQDNSPPSP